MNLSKGEYEIKLTDSEAFDLALAIYFSLDQRIESHYNHLQQEKDGEPIFFDYEKHMLGMMKFLLSLTSREETYKSYVSSYKSKFEKRRKEREIKSEVGNEKL